MLPVKSAYRIVYRSAGANGDPLLSVMLCLAHKIYDRLDFSKKPFQFAGPPRGESRPVTSIETPSEIFANYFQPSIEAPSTLPVPPQPALGRSRPSSCGKSRGVGGLTGMGGTGGGGEVAGGSSGGELSGEGGAVAGVVLSCWAFIAGHRGKLSQCSGVGKPLASGATRRATWHVTNKYCCQASCP